MEVRVRDHYGLGLYHIVTKTSIGLEMIQLVDRQF